MQSSRQVSQETVMSSGRGRLPKAAAVAALLQATLFALAATPSQANPATVSYRCKPAPSGGGLLSVDYDSGGRSIIAQFPDGRSIRMSGRAKRFYMYYAGEHTKVWGIGQKTINLAVTGQPTRRCVATSL
jgi:hypothetical protein